MSDLYSLIEENKQLDETGYVGFPAFIQEKNEAPFILEITIPTAEDLMIFANLVGIESLKNLDRKRNTKSIWFPELEYGERGSNGNYIWIEVE